MGYNYLHTHVVLENWDVDMGKNNIQGIYEMNARKGLRRKQE